MVADQMKSIFADNNLGQFFIREKENAVEKFCFDAYR